MGFSLVAAAAIIGVSVLIAIEVIVGTTVPTFTNVHESFREMKDRAINQVQTDINITSVTTEANGSNTDINITIKNIGSTSLETSYFYILINGTRNSFTCSNSFLHPEDEVYFNVSSLPSTGPRRLKVVTNNGISDYYDFTI
jgi:archaellum component FlaF (FlaF/FlaG flagellin family)